MSESPMMAEARSSIAPGPHYKADATDALPTPPRVRLIAFYLPQFHPIPENDAWWGKGFTEWTNVVRGMPRFAGHVQPRLPGDLGFYDLLDPATMRRQIALAKRYGVGGFCFHHYWFNGRRLLEKPLEMLLADPSLDMPFCINWANENWTRRWDGNDDEILMAQAHSPQDDVDFARSLLPIVRDRRYITVDGRPLVMIYRPGAMPEPLATMRRWRVAFMSAGLNNPYIVMAQGFGDADPRQYGVDAAVEFPPHKVAATPTIEDSLRILDPDFAGRVMDYAAVAQYAMSLPRPPYTLFRCVAPSWDNEARRPGRGMTLAHSTPETYGAWLQASCRTALEEASHPDERMVFINAWNEWGEGAHLEPDRHFGYAYLIETRRALWAMETASITPDAPAAKPEQSLPDLAGEEYLTVLERLHRELRPRTYIEVGTRNGDSLHFVTCPAVAIDPAFHLTDDMIRGKPVCAFYQMTSDTYFARFDPKQVLGGAIEFAFLDGLHQCEFLLRDFMNVERHCKPESVVVLHDCVPVETPIADRSRTGRSIAPHRRDWWVGDVWRVLRALKRYRTDLRIVVLDAPPSGLVCVTNLDPRSRVLADCYDKVVSDMLSWSLDDIGLGNFVQSIGLQPTSRFDTAEAIIQQLRG